MTFLYPGFLWALLAMSIPLVIHLFNFRKTQKVYFSNTRFIQQVQEATSAKRKLKHLLVLAARLLFIFFLVLVFAQPILPAREQLKPGAVVALYLDNSQSMSAPAADGVRALDMAISTANALVQNLPFETRYRLLTNDFEPFSNSLKTGKEVQDQLTQIRLSGRKRSAQEITHRLQLGDTADEIFWLSDFQQSTLGDFQSEDSTQRFHLLPIQGPATSNLFVDTVFLNNPFPIGGERNALTVRLHNDGDQERNQITVRFTIDGLQAGTATTTLAPHAFGEVNFELPSGEQGARKVLLSFTDNPISFDNEFYAVLDFSNRLTVLEIKEEANRTAIETVFGNKKVFEVESFQSKNVNYGRLARTNLLVLNEVSRLDAALLQSVQNYLDGGGSVLIIPSDKPDLLSYKALVPSLQESRQEQLLGLAKPDFNNPFFASIFQEQSAQMAMPVVRNSLEWGSDRQAILVQQDGKPYLSLFQDRGTIFVLGGPLKPAYSTLSNHALFVPVMYRLAASTKRRQQELYHLVTQSVVSIAGDSLSDNALVTLVGKEELTPAQRKAPSDYVLDLAGLDIKEGVYAVKRGEDTLTWLAFNQDKQESKFKLIQEEALRESFGPQADLYQVQDQSTQAMAAAIKENYQGTPLWKYALVAALFFILMEVVLLRFWRS